MSNVHPVFEPILNAIFPQVPEQSNKSTDTKEVIATEKREKEPTMEGFANWLIAGKPKL